MTTTTTTTTTSRVLVVDDDPLVRRALARALRAGGLEALEADGGAGAMAVVESGGCDVIVSDVVMPDMDGITLLRRVHERDRDVPVILVTARPDLGSATRAVALGAFEYLTKPLDMGALPDVVRRAADVSRLARQKADALKLVQGMADRGGLEALAASFQRGLETLWIAYQPVLTTRSDETRLYGYEALLRSDEGAFPTPLALFDAAERLHRPHVLGRLTRDRVAQQVAGAPADLTMFLNLHAHELVDPTLYDPDAPLSPHASRVVLEITARASLDSVTDLQARVRRLRDLGYRIAIDDIGGGYAGLASFATLEPDVVKLDLALVRAIDVSDKRQRLVQSMVGLCHGMGTLVAAEGIETAAERDCLVALGCDLLQGYLFARPGPAFPPWSSGD